MDFKNGVINKQAMGYSGACTVDQTFKQKFSCLCITVLQKLGHATRYINNINYFNHNNNCSNNYISNYR